MPHIARILKEEIARIRSQGGAARSRCAEAQHGPPAPAIAALKRQVADVVRKLLQRSRGAEASGPQAPPAALRFRAEGLASHRKRLGLSATELGRMFGVSDQTIYLWESGRARPRAPQHMPAIATMRTLGHSQAAAMLKSLA